MKTYDSLEQNIRNTLKKLVFWLVYKGMQLYFFVIDKTKFKWPNVDIKLLPNLSHPLCAQCIFVYCNVCSCDIVIYSFVNFCTRENELNCKYIFLFFFIERLITSCKFNMSPLIVEPSRSFWRKRIVGKLKQGFLLILAYKPIIFSYIF